MNEFEEIRLKGREAYNYERKIQQLKAENEELKEAYCNGLDEYKICRSLQNAEHRIHELETVLDENEELKKSLKEITLYTTRHCTDKRALYVDKLLFDCNKAEHCLDEIEEIANAIVNGTHFTTDIEEHFKELTKRILQLIQQVKEGRRQ